MKAAAEYFWIGTGKARSLKSKVKMLTVEESGIDPKKDLPLIPGLDDGKEIFLQPGFYAVDPLRAGGVVCLCEVFTDEKVAHEANWRAKLRARPMLSNVASVRVVQQFGLAAKEGKISRHQVQKIVDAHLAACDASGLMLDYYDASGAPDLIEFAVEVGNPKNPAGLIGSADRFCVARYFLSRIADLNDVLIKKTKTQSTQLEVIQFNGEEETVNTVDDESDADPYELFAELLDKATEETK